MEQYIGKTLDDRYEILECIGTGGMAVVYKARDHRLNRLVAVKILKSELAGDAEFRRRFHDESQAVAMLSHVNIVSVYDVSQSDGLDYIVMELIDGLTLKQYMKKRGTPLNWREALHFITQIVRALGHAHSRGIIHRDIKPHNILVLRDGSVKVTDFGIAQIASAAQHTMTSETLGSVHYISPEQARGSHVDCRTDLYSAGVVLYEMLTGRLPFEGDTPVFVAIQHINSIPLQPRELNPDIPVALESIILKAMAPELDQRYASAEEMLADLKEFRKNPGMTVTPPIQVEAEDEPTMVVPVSRMSGEPLEYRTQEPASARERRRQEPAPVRERRRKEVPEEEPDDEQPRRLGGVLAAIGAVLVVLIFLGGIVYFLWNFFQGVVSKEAEEYVVPNVLGYTVEQLEQNPGLLDGFVIEIGRTEYNDVYPEGKICGQSPEHGSTVREGSRVITVTISGGTDNLYMENVIGWEYRRALSVLRDEMGLTVNLEYGYSENIAEGYIISCDPLPEAQLEKGDTVTILISQGPAIHPVTVVSFVGQRLEQAKEMIEGLGLTVGEIKEYSNNDYGEGIVFWQSIPNGTEVEPGTAIRLYVSTGPEPTPEPTPTPTPEPTPEPTPTPTPEPTPEPTPTPTPTPEPTPEPTPTPEPPQPTDDNGGGGSGEEPAG